MDLGSHLHHHHLESSTSDPILFAGYAAIFSYSFLTSLHCIGMCGPLACSVLNRQKSKIVQSALLYNLGRLLSYTLAGALVGLFAQQLSAISGSIGFYLALTLGMALIATSVLPERLRKSWFPTRVLPNQLQRRLLAIISPWSSNAKAIGLGFITVLLPCMTLHPLLLAAAGTQSAQKGAAMMSVFALGTLPAMLAATCMPTLFANKFPTRWISVLSRGCLMVAGLITVWRALVAM